ncbi:nuclease-related domain-containing protein [Mycoplasma buteonis]|uniref:nuclease-related domain-containing protein n=1 Tax=Mycoplasma buteonis TaxID=171280 RepID=UPI00055B249E|nr:nuclease-related domain-containing protein [Mycoplasma buteonis]
MNNHIIITVIMICIFLLLICSWIVLYFLSKINKNKALKSGFEFENQVNLELKRITKNKKITWFGGDIYKYDNKYFEIDGFLIFQNLVVVVEVKSYHGILSGFGNSQSVMLSSQTKNGIKNVEFKNPVIQNERHMNHIAKIIGSTVPIASLIVFPDDLKNNLTNVPNHVVLANMQDLESVIKNFYLYSKQNKNINCKPKIIKNAMNNFRVTSKKEKNEFQKIVER